MGDAETDEQQTLIRAAELEGVSVSGVVAGSPATSLLQQDVPAWYLPLHAAGLVLVTTGLVVVLPVYLEVLNVAGDAYAGLSFVWSVTTVTVVLYVQLRYSYFCQVSRLGPTSPLRVARVGGLHGLAVLLMVYSLDRHRVVCHAQEPIMGLVLMYTIILYFFYKGPELSSPKMFSLCGVLGGLFLALDYQLNNKYQCHGQYQGQPGVEDEGPWSLETHSLWTIVYCLALFLFTLSWLLLEKEVLTKKFGVSGRPLVSTVSGAEEGASGDMEGLVEGASSLPLPPHLSGTSKWGLHLVWFCLGSFLVILCLLWTDFFTAVGKAGSPQQFVNLTSAGWGCHFHWGGRCGSVALYGWLGAALHLAFLGLMGRVVASSHSMIFSLAMAALALPLQALWWALFTIGGPWGMTWHPQVTGELIFSLLGLPVMLACLGFWHNTDVRDKQRSNSLPLLHT